MTDPYDILRLSLLPKVGPTRGRALARSFGSYADILRASPRDLLRTEGFQDVLARAVHATLHDEAHRTLCESTVDRNRLLAERGGFVLLPYTDAAYPAALRRIYDAPLFLFCKGVLTSREERAIAVVGTRMPSDYGRKVAAMLAQELADAGLTTVSGLALGIDTVAHTVALSSGGRTVAVLGSGLANIYPASNRRLAAQIAEHGCVLSELPLEALPDAVNFPRRNRIISGLSAATIVVESGVKGGAMITAELALDQNKDVYAIPGSIFNPKSAGPNLLLKKGVARPFTSLQDLADELPSLFGQRAGSSVPAQMSMAEQQLYDSLDDEPRHIDDLAFRIGLPTSDLLVTLLHMEFRGLARQHPGKYFTKG
jgi:DNA processing protein